MMTQISSLHGEVAEAEQLVERWNAEVVNGDELCTLRLHILSALTKEVGKTMFGSDASKLSDDVSERKKYSTRIFFIFLKIHIYCPFKV